MLQTEFHAIGNMTSPILAPEEPLPSAKSLLTEETFRALVREMESMVVEHNLQLQKPIGSLWKAAISKRRKIGEESSFPESTSEAEASQDLSPELSAGTQPLPSAAPPVQHQETPPDIDSNSRTNKETDQCNEVRMGLGVVSGPDSPMES